MIIKLTLLWVGESFIGMRKFLELFGCICVVLVLICLFRKDNQSSAMTLKKCIPFNHQGEQRTRMILKSTLLVGGFHLSLAGFHGDLSPPFSLVLKIKIEREI